MESFRTICRCCISEGVPSRSLWVALIVGTSVNLINQGDALLTRGSVSWIKVVLTFVLPNCVATYEAVSLRLRDFPQAFVHAALIGAVIDLRAAEQSGSGTPGWPER